MQISRAPVSHKDPTNERNVFVPVKKPDDFWRRLFNPYELLEMEAGEIIRKGLFFYRSASEARPALVKSPKGEIIEVIRLNPSQDIMLHWLRNNPDKVPEWARWMTVDNAEHVQVPNLVHFIDKEPERGRNCWKVTDHKYFPKLGDKENHVQLPISNWEDAILELEKVKWN